jgi:hypothetical protein
VFYVVFYAKVNGDVFLPLTVDNVELFVDYANYVGTSSSCTVS